MVAITPPQRKSLRHIGLYEDGHQRRMSVLSRFLSAHHAAPQRLERRSVTLASPVNPGRQNPLSCSDIRASTARVPEVETRATLSIAPSVVRPSAWKTRCTG